MNKVILSVSNNGFDRTPLINGKELFDGSEIELLEVFASLLRTNEIHLVITPNVDQVVRLEEDDNWRDIFQSATLLVPDGTPLVRTFKLLGVKGLQVITGADLLTLCIEKAEHLNWRVAIIGGSEQSNHLLNEFFKGQKMIQVIPLPYFDSESINQTKTAIDQLHIFGPHICFVCLGSPKQEVWINYWNDVLPAAIYVGAGAAAEFLSGTVSRAPRLFRKLGFEWAWRLLQEPRRLFNRYIVKGPKFIPIIINSLWHQFSKK